MTRKGPDQVDQIVGRNIRIYRLQKGLTQTDLGDGLGLTFQQVQKYEKGTNRVGSGRLLKIATFLDVPVTALFKGSDEMADTDKQSIFDQLATPHANRLLQAFAQIDNDGLRRSVVQLVEEIANSHSL
jgi:transcriptional regulator with XRE-family HTH domain